MRRGFTLLELLVVLLVMGLALALVAPTLLPHATRARDPLGEALDMARQAALRRAETVELEISASGAWTLYAATSPGEAPLSTSRLERWTPRAAVTIVVSPTGTCGIAARSLAAAGQLRLQPFTCEVATP
jgi:prepilin-type N-terminal cleavage/methylation domain-containing protein